MRKIISFSLWRNDCERELFEDKYLYGALKNISLRDKYYSDWHIIFYVDHTSVPSSYITMLKSKKNVEVRPLHTNDPNMWLLSRFIPADSNDIVIIRDADSRISFREVIAVRSWLDSKYDFHIMRDHPYHRVPIMGGMWGTRNGLLSGLYDEIITYYHNNKHRVFPFGIDQAFLAEVVYPTVRFNALVHDEFFEKKPFPSGNFFGRTNSYFVGQAFEADGTPCT